MRTKSTEARSNLERLRTGVARLDETIATVARLREELTILQPQLKAKAEETARLLTALGKEQADVAAVREVVTAEERVVRAKAAEVEVVQAEAQRELDVALPALQAAMDALNRLDKKDIPEVRTFTQPPEGVRIVMEAVCVLLGEPPSWDTSKRILGNPNFIRALQSYDKDALPTAVLRKLARYTSDPLMKPDAVAKVSRAATTSVSACGCMPSSGTRRWRRMWSRNVSGSQR